MRTLKMLIAWAFVLVIVWCGPMTVDAVMDVRQTYVDKSTAPMIVVMNYHHIGYEGEYPKIENIRVSPEDFKKQLETFKLEGYTTISQQDLIGYLKGTGKIPKKSLYITIDDGYQSIYTYAYPALKELGMTAMFFPVISHIESGERLGAPMVTWEQLREMAASQVLTVGNHTYDLHWRKDEVEGQEAMIGAYNKEGRLLTKEKRYEMIYNDLVKAEAIYKEKTGLTMEKAISYPYGAYNELVLDIVEELGYEIGFTVENGYHVLGTQSNLLEVKRYGVSYRNTVEKLLHTIEKSEALANEKYAQRNMRVLSFYDQYEHGLRLTVSATRGWTSVKNIQFEVWKVENGQRVFVAPASVGEERLSYGKQRVIFREKLAEHAVYEKGTAYSMKVVMTNMDGSVDNEWVDFTY